MQLWSWLKVTKLREVSDMVAMGRRPDAIRRCGRLRGLRRLVERGESGLAISTAAIKCGRKIPMRCECACHTHRVLITSGGGTVATEGVGGLAWSEDEGCLGCLRLDVTASGRLSCCLASGG